MKLLREFGYIQACNQCDHIRSFSGHKAGIAHSDACRDRITAAMAATARGAARFEDEELRINRAIADRIRHADVEAVAAAPPPVEPLDVPDLDAAMNWAKTYTKLMVDHGFVTGKHSACNFWHPTRDVAVTVHGDDFTSSGPKPALDWLEKSISEKYEITVEPRLGPGPNDAKEGRVLNRVIRWCESSIEYETDPRQVERLVSECGLEGAKSVVTPGLKVGFA